jgi:branched-subunit amino acid transport protein AzlD
MTSSRRTAAVAGALFLVTHVTSVTALALYGAIRTHADYIAGNGPDTPALRGAFLEVVLAIVVVGTAVTLFPVVKRHNESLALGYVGLRTLEAAIIAVGVVPLLAVVTLRQDRTPDAIAVGRAMVALHDWTFLVGPSLVLGTNTVLLATVLYRSGLVPRFIPVLGLVGGPLVFASGAAQLFGLFPQISAWAAVTAVPVFAWEICLALYLVVKGFRPSATAPVQSAIAMTSA